MDTKYESEKERAIKGVEKMREDLEASGKIDRYEKMQPKQRPKIDQSFVGAHIEQLWEYTETKKGTEKKVLQWCKGEVVGVKKNNKVHIQWASHVLRRGDPEVTEEQFMVSKWNKHVKGSWRMFFD